MVSLTLFFQLLAIPVFYFYFILFWWWCWGWYPRPPDCWASTVPLSHIPALPKSFKTSPSLFSFYFFPSSATANLVSSKPAYQRHCRHCPLRPPFLWFWINREFQWGSLFLFIILYSPYRSLSNSFGSCHSSAFTACLLLCFPNHTHTFACSVSSQQVCFSPRALRFTLPSGWFFLVSVWLALLTAGPLVYEALPDILSFLFSYSSLSALSTLCSLLTFFLNIMYH